MSIIKVTVDDQNLHITDAPKIAAQGVNEDYVEFSFSSEWTGFGKTALFYREEDEATVYESIVNANGVALVPHEVTAKDGKICFGVCGVKDDIVLTSEIVKYKIVKGRYTAGEESQPPTLGIYEQMLALAGDMIQDQADFENNINTAIDHLSDDLDTKFDNFSDEVERTIAGLIDDTSTGSSSSTWSSSKIDDKIEATQNLINTRIGQYSAWKTLGTYTGAVWANVPANAVELYIKVDVVYSPDHRDSITFLVPVPIIPTANATEVLVNHYTTTNDGYCAIRLNASRVGLWKAYNGTSDVTSATYWDVYYR